MKVLKPTNNIIKIHNGSLNVACNKPNLSCGIDWILSNGNPNFSKNFIHILCVFKSVFNCIDTA
jgi:hypothetical protein